MFMMKKNIARLLVFALVLSLLPIAAAAVEDGFPSASFTVKGPAKNGTAHSYALIMDGRPEPSTADNPYEVGSDSTKIELDTDGILTVYIDTDMADASVENGTGTSGTLTKSGTKWTYTEELDPVPTVETVKTLRFNVKNGDKTAYYKLIFTIQPPGETPAESFWLYQTELTLGIGESRTLRAGGSGTAGIPDLNWTSSDSTVAAVDETGKVTGVRVGSATITATLKKDPNASQTCEVTVSSRKAAGVILDQTSISLLLSAGYNSAHPEPIILYDDGTASGYQDRAFEKVTWTSSDTNVATVEEGDGFVQAVGVGTAVITAVLKEDPTKSATCTVTVGNVECKYPVVGEISKDETAYNNASDVIKNVMDAIISQEEVSFRIANTMAAVQSENGDVTFNGKTLATAGQLNGGTPVIVPKVDIKVADGKSEDGRPVSITFDLSYSAEVHVKQGSSTIKVTDPVTIENPGMVSVSIYDSSWDTLYNHFVSQGVVKHTKTDGKVFWHWTWGPDGYIMFDNSHGFSEFALEAADEVELNGKYYSLSDALEIAKSGDTINVLNSYGEVQTVSTDLTFKLAEGVRSLNITAADGYTVSAPTPDSDGVLTISVTAKRTENGGNSGSSSSGGNGGGSSRPSIRPGAGSGAPAAPSNPTTPSTPSAPSGGVAGFSDVSTGSWYAGSVKFVVEKGLFGGVGNGNFAPDSNMTRAMMWTVLARYMGVNTNSGSNWYEAARTWAMAQNISDGTMADGNVTREQFVTMLWRLSGEPTAEASAGFTDNGSISGYAKTAVDWAVAQGILNGYNDGSFRPQGSATRAEVAKMLTVFCENANVEA